MKARCSSGEGPEFSSCDEIFEWLSRFVNLERGQSAKSFRLDRMELLADLAGHPEKSAPAIHVAGSKGKGSVTAMTASILTAAGFKTGRYLSPHVRDWRERLGLGDGFFPESIYIEAAGELRRLVEGLPSSRRDRKGLFDPGLENGEEPTFFELVTLYFFLCVRRASCQAMVVETGMGGRLDATNILKPEVSVITGIELEHTEYLGNTIRAIAGEKAGIIKKGRPLILAEQKDAALEVFRRAAEAKGAALEYFPEKAEIRNLAIRREGTEFTLVWKEAGLFPAPLDLFIPVPGEIQARNAGLAVMAAKTAFPSVTAEAVREGLKNAALPARFERLRFEGREAPRDLPVVIIDGAHTPVSVENCVQTFTSLYGEGGILLFGCAAGKDAAAMAGILVSHFSRIIITAPGSFKISHPEEVFGAFEEKVQAAPASRTPPELSLIKETAAAVKTALERARKTGLPLLVTGSFYLAAEVSGLQMG